VAVKEKADVTERFSFGCILINIWQVDGFLYLRFNDKTLFENVSKTKKIILLLG
jgi:hypothetical protein